MYIVNCIGLFGHSTSTARLLLRCNAQLFLDICIRVVSFWLPAFFPVKLVRNRSPRSKTSYKTRYFKLHKVHVTITIRYKICDRAADLRSSRRSSCMLCKPHKTNRPDCLHLSLHLHVNCECESEASTLTLTLTR